MPPVQLRSCFERVECARTHPNFRRSRPAKKRNTTGERMIGRDEERHPARRLEIARGGWRKFVVRFGIHIIEVGKNPELIVTDLVLESRVPAPALLLRIRARVEIEVKPGKNTESGPRTTVVEDIVGRRNQSVGIIRRRAKELVQPDHIRGQDWCWLRVT